MRKFHREKQYEGKLNRYLKIVDKMRGFVKNVGSGKDREEFVNSYRTIWLYGKADVVKYVSQFLKIVFSPPKEKDKIGKAKDEAKSILKSAVVAMRKDLKAKGKLKEDDFDIFV